MAVKINEFELTDCEKVKEVVEVEKLVAAETKAKLANIVNKNNPKSFPFIFLL